VDEAPRYLIRDRDAVYGTVVTRRLRAMGIRDKPISAGSPWQNCFAERLIGTIRRECVNHLMVLGEAHLRRVLVEFAAYYNGSRIHHSLSKDAPFHRAIERLGGDFAGDFVSLDFESESALAIRAAIATGGGPGPVASYVGLFVSRLSLSHVTNGEQGTGKNLDKC